MRTSIAFSIACLLVLAAFGRTVAQVPDLTEFLGAAERMDRLEEGELHG